MARYYVNDNAQNNGDHEVHTTGCPYLPMIVSKAFLGSYSSCGPFFLWTVLPVDRLSRPLRECTDNPTDVGHALVLVTRASLPRYQWLSAMPPAIRNEVVLWAS